MLEELLGIFGGTGAVLLGIGTCVWGVLKRYSFDFVRGMPISNVPIETLQNSWEIPFDEECEKPCNRMVFATKNDKDQWKINMKNGSVYLFTDIFNASPTKFHFMRIKLKNVPKNCKIKFNHKYWTGDSHTFIEHENHRHKSTPIQRCDGVHTYYEPCLIGQDGITKEQLGVYFKGDFNNCILEEAYIGYDKKGLCGFKCCCKRLCTIFFEKKKSDK